MFTIALIIYLVFLTVYLAFFWALTYHLRNYYIPGERLPVIARALVLSMMLLAAFSVVAFMAVPWDTIPKPSSPSTSFTPPTL